MDWMWEIASLIWELAGLGNFALPGKSHWPFVHVTQRPVIGHLSSHSPYEKNQDLKLAQISDLQSTTLQWPPSISTDDLGMKSFLGHFTMNKRRHLRNHELVNDVLTGPMRFTRGYRDLPFPLDLVNFLISNLQCLISALLFMNLML